MYSNCNERLNKNCYGQYFPQTSIDLSNNCISGCDNILTRSTYYSSWNDLVDNDILIDVSDKLEIFGFFKLSDNSRWNISSYTTTHATLQDLPYCGQTPPGTGNCPTGQTITLPWNDINNTFRACSALKLTGPNSGEEKYLGTNSGIIAFITAPYNGVEWSSFETVPNRFSYKKITDDARISHSSTTSPDVYLVDSGCPMDPKTYYMATKSINFGYYKTLI